MKIYFDTNVLLAASLANHPHHAPAEATLLKVHRREIEGCISTHGLAEFYAVLTRVPLAPPVFPSEAWQMLERNVLGHFEVVWLSTDVYLATLQHCAAAGWTGGRIYDVLHLAAARQAACGLIYTFNLRHLRELAPDFADRIRRPGNG